MRRTSRLLAALLPAWIGMVLLPTSATANEADLPQPNVVIIISDDLGWNDVGYHGGDVQTPSIDRLAAEGVQLDRFYTYPICGLSRAALMTGISSDRTRVNNNRGLPLHHRILPQYFCEAEYQTWFLGKWHLGGFVHGEGLRFQPHLRGFDHFYGHLGGAIDYWRHIHIGSNSPDWQRNGKPVQEEGYTTDLLADEATRLIESRDKTRPFLLVLSFNAVHQPLQSPTDPSIATRHVDAGARSIYREMVASMDAAIGRVVTAIDAQGQTSQTIVVFMSDNGGLQGHAASNAPLRGGKGTLFDGGIRVPCLVCWPGVLPRGAISRQLIWAADLLPTVAAAAGVEIHEARQLDGVNLWPQLRELHSVPRSGFVINRRSRGWAFVSEDWKLIHLPKTKDTFLFRIDLDACETTDVSREHPEIVRVLVEKAQAATPGDMLQVDFSRKSGRTAKIISLVVAVALICVLGLRTLRSRRCRRRPAISHPSA